MDFQGVGVLGCDLADRTHSLSGSGVFSTMDIFGLESPLLQWLPDESLFSLCSRLHQLWGHSTSAPSSMLMFGHRRRGMQHDLPSGLSAFALRTDACYGTAGYLAQERTLLAYYRPFLEPAVIRDLAFCMSSNSVAHLKFRLGLLTSRFRANHPLKSCPGCMEQDREQHGWSYWHLSHQYPGVWYCIRHQELLRVSLVKSNGVERFLWHLPKASRLVPAVRVETQDVRTALSRLAQFVNSVYQSCPKDGCLSSHVLQTAFRERVAELGWITTKSSLRLDVMSDAFMTHVRELRTVAEFESLPRDANEASVQLGRLLRPMRSGTHPLRWFVMASWLFDSAEDFLKATAMASRELSAFAIFPPVLHEGGATEARDANQVRKQSVIENMRAGASAASSARAVGVDVATAMAWAAGAGIQVMRRAKVLVPGKRAVLTADLLEGLDKEAVAVKHGVSVETVTRFLRTEVGLHQKWTTRRFEMAQGQARSTWSSLLEEHATLGIKFVRSLAPGIYAWLYRNDRAWLQEHSPTARLGLQARRSSVRWDERDIELSQRVQQFLLDLQGKQPQKKLHLWQVIQALPELGPKLRVLDRLPLTRKVLEQVLLPRIRATGQANLPL